MHSDKDNPVTAKEPPADGLESSKENTLNWLMELDRDEPEENLFVVEGKVAELTLSAHEAEVAARPMTRGRAGADDLGTYVSEEIVMTEQGSSNRAGVADDEEAAFEGLMAIDFSRDEAADGDVADVRVDDGSDILGLAEDDEIGETYLVARRIAREPQVASASSESEADLAEAAPEPAAPQALVDVEDLESPVDLDSDDGIDGDEVESISLLADVVEDATLATEVETADQEQTSVDLPVTDVTSYVTSVQAPTSDEDFDDYLVAGSELAIGDDNLDELCIEVDEQEFSVDTALDSDIELHEDFVALEGFDDELMAAITPRLGAFMDEVNAAVAARLVSLGRRGDAVVADVTVATDVQTRASAEEQEYQPIMAICAAVPESLEGLEPSQLDAVMLRLGDAETGEACNRLFLDEPVEAGESQATPVLTVVESTVFNEDIFGEELAVEMPPGDWAPENEEIDAIFDDFGSDDIGLEFDSPLTGTDAPESADSLEIMESIEFEDTPGDAEVIESVVGAEAAEAQMPEPEAAVADKELDEELLQVFEENMFEADLIEEEALQPVSAEDIDRLMEDLGPEVEVAGEICGVELEEFTGTSANEELIAEDAQATEPVEVSVPAVAEAAAEDMSWCIPEGISFHHSSPSSGEIFAEFLDAFIEEGSSELEKLEDAIGAWEADIASEENFTRVARVLHTIKGIAKGVGLHFYGTLIHNFETLLEAMPRPASSEEHDYFRIVNAWLDAAVRGMDFVQEERRDILCEFPTRGAQSTAPETLNEAVAPVETADEPSAAAPEEGVDAPEQEVARVAKDPRRKEEDKKLADEGARALAAQQSVRITSEKLDLLLNLSNQAQQLGVRTAQSTNRTKRASAELMGRLSSVRAHIADIADGNLFNVASRGGRSSELDALEMDQYSELQEAANILREGVEDLADLIEVASRHNAQAEALLKQQASVIGSIGSSIRAARVVPVSRLMPGLRRLVRTVSNDLGKDVAFRVANEVGTLDRDDYARCQTILEHMVRNALDHGIEPADERMASGKPSVGQITVDVRMSGADSIIVLSDDGRGIDPDAMRESAIRKGLELDAYALSDDEARNLIFHKGFSTAASLSQISGRGVGMDIVLSELQQMGGDIQIESEVGKGTSFHIRIPANVTVNGALLVTAGENSYAIPLGGLVAVEEVPVEEFFGAVENGEKLLMSGMDCEPAYLGTLCKSGNLPDRGSWRSSVPVIIAGSEARYMAIAIDDVEEALELVIRSLGAQFASVPGVAGAATTADGEAVVALDLNVLVSCIPEGQGTAVAVDQPEEEKFLALVVDDSRTQRMVATSQLETVGIETATAENGAVAIDWLNTTEHLPDVILLDVEMPVKDGIQTLREIRKSARYSHIPVIMVTSRTGIKHRTMAEEAGCNGYMGKPFNFRMLIGQINELTGHRLELG